jgi:hypothetical protein
MLYGRSNDNGSLARGMLHGHFLASAGLIAIPGRPIWPALVPYRFVGFVSRLEIGIA